MAEQLGRDIQRASGRAADNIFEDLRQGILRGDQPRGTKLPAERDLAVRYGVSGPTIREAIRGLSLLGLVDVRHGSGTYVSADIPTIMALSLGSVIQLEQLQAPDVLQVFGLLSREAARLAAEQARPAQVASLREAVGAIEDFDSIEQAIERIRAFHTALAVACGNSLLGALCNFLSDLQLNIARSVVEPSVAEWRQVISRLQPFRLSLVEAIAEGKANEAQEATRIFTGTAASMIEQFFRERTGHSGYPDLGNLLASMTSPLPR